MTAAVMAGAVFHGGIGTQKPVKQQELMIIWKIQVTADESHS